MGAKAIGGSDTCIHTCVSMHSQREEELEETGFDIECLSGRPKLSWVVVELSDV